MYISRLGSFSQSLQIVAIKSSASTPSFEKTGIEKASKTCFAIGI
jgi:hypothetical protein